MQRRYPKNRYQPWTYKRECDVCGQDYLRVELREMWDGKIVCKYDYDVKHPRDEPRPSFTQRLFKRD